MLPNSDGQSELERALATHDQTATDQAMAAAAKNKVLHARVEEFIALMRKHNVPTATFITAQTSQDRSKVLGRVRIRNTTTYDLLGYGWEIGYPGLHVIPDVGIVQPGRALAREPGRHGTDKIVWTARLSAAVPNSARSSLYFASVAIGPPNWEFIRPPFWDHQSAKTFDAECLAKYARQNLGRA